MDRPLKRPEIRICEVFVVFSLKKLLKNVKLWLIWEAMTLKWRHLRYDGHGAFFECFISNHGKLEQKVAISQKGFNASKLLTMVNIWGENNIQTPWWRHQKETFSESLAICAGNSPVTGEFPAQKAVTQNFDVFFDLRLIKRLSKQWWDW